MVGIVRIAGILAAGLVATGCSSITNHRGFLADEVLLRSIQPGIDNRTSVERTLGQPSFVSQFGEPVWYYISSTTSQKPFTVPTISQQMVLAVRFDAVGNVLSAERSGMERVARINPDDAATPTVGRERGFLEDLFGNIGRVGANGTSAPTGGGG